MLATARPNKVECFIYDGDLIGDNGPYVPEWAISAFKEGIIFYDSPDISSPPSELYIRMPDGRRHVNVGDYVVRQADGSIYSHDPEQFNKFYKVNIEPDIKAITDRNIAHLKRYRCKHMAESLWDDAKKTHGDSERYLWLLKWFERWVELEEYYDGIWKKLAETKK